MNALHMYVHSMPSTQNPKLINLDTKKKKEKQRLYTSQENLVAMCVCDFQLRDQFTTIYIPEMCAQRMHGVYRQNAYSPINKSLIAKSAAALCAHSHTFASYISYVVGICLLRVEQRNENMPLRLFHFAHTYMLHKCSIYERTLHQYLPSCVSTFSCIYQHVCSSDLSGKCWKSILEYCVDCY